jgi:hypothetical protein
VRVERGLSDGRGVHSAGRRRRGCGLGQLLRSSVSGQREGLPGRLLVHAGRRLDAVHAERQHVRLID